MSDLYLECLSGISGDMFVAALLDLGADEKVLQTVLDSIPIDGFQTRISWVKKAGIRACDFDVILEHRYDNHDHDMEYLMGKDTSKTEEHHDHMHHHQEHRGMDDILEILNHTDMTDNARKHAIRIFTILGQAEAKAHGTTLEQVHFHEVGAIDSIADIISAAVCLDNLQVNKVIIPVLYEGSGQIRCQHGILPVPVPAVTNIVCDNQLSLHITDMEGELVTPTGAAIAAAIKTDDRCPDSFKIQKIGMGAGKREYKNPSILRAMLIQEEKDRSMEEDVIYKLESNIDDCSGENFGYVMDKLLQAGARDVNYIPIFMKKNRPAYQLNVICKAWDVEKMEQIIFKETSTIGIRKLLLERSILKRESREIQTSMGKAKVKVCELNQEKRVYPEYESVVDLCRQSGRSFQEVFKCIERESYGRFDK